MRINDLQKYTELYDIEKHLFDVVGPRASKRGYLTFEEFYKICMWKSARQKQKYISAKNRKQVEAIIKDAFTEQNEKEKIRKLCELNGVGIPTASAILSVVFPEKYAVIDVRCLEVLRDTFGQKFNKFISSNTWLIYTDLMQRWAKENNTTPRKLDMAFFAMHREKLEKEDFRNLYKQYGFAK